MATRPRAGVPAQTLSFLFADLRDYTAFVEARGDVAATALIAEYRRIVRAAVAETGGGEIKTEGDSFYVVFASARQALQCAVAILREADRHTREHATQPIRVGIGIHLGEPVPHEGQYVGSAVNVAARLAQQARAGELLVSEVVRGILRTAAAPQMTEREGLALKGVQDPPRVYAVAWQQPTAPSGLAAPREVAIAAEQPTDRRILCPQVIGREPELAALDALLADARAGRGRTALVAGEAGVGKSAFLRLFAERARAAGFRYVLGECTEVEARRPFGPFVDALRAAFRDLSAAGREDELATTELLRLVPELSRAGTLPTAQSDEERYRVHAAFARVLADITPSGPLVVAVEDLHWADEATLELFPYLARKLRDQRVLLLGTYRSDELHRLHPLNHLLAELARGRLAEEVALHKLTLEETGAVIRAALRLQRDPTTEFRAAIQERCEGNPFFIEEVLKALVERGDISYRDGAWRRTKDVPSLAIPVSIRDAVQQRMRLLSPDARRAVQVAAVIGQRFDFELLRRVTGFSEEALLDALKAAVDAQLVGEVPDHGTEELYAFRHALTRESVLAELLQRERRLLHRAVGEAVEVLSGSDTARRAEELAYHFDEARDQARAFRYHELAAREAVRVFAFARATRHLERAVELAEDDEATLPDLQLRLADAAFLASDSPRALRAAEEARRLLESRGDVRGMGAALTRLALYHWYLGSPEADARAADAVRLLEPLGESTELAASYGEVARLAMLDNRSEEAIEWGERAVALAERTGAIDVRTLALNTVGAAMTNDGRTHGLELLRESLRLSLEHELVGHAQRAYNNLSAASARLGLPAAELRAIHDESLQHARRYGLRLAVLLNREAGYALVDGDWDRALQLIEEFDPEMIWYAGWQVAGLALIALAREGPERPLPLIDAPRRRLLAADAQSRGSAGFSAEVLLLAGDLRGTLEHAEVIAELLADDYWHPGVSAAAMSAISAARLLADEAALTRWIELSLTQGSHAGARYQQARRAFAQAELVARDGDRESALAMLSRCVELLVDALPVQGSFARLRRAELLLENGDREGASAELAVALTYWRKAKATWYLGQLRAWAAERGLAFPE